MRAKCDLSLQGDAGRGYLGPGKRDISLSQIESRRAVPPDPTLNMFTNEFIASYSRKASVMRRALVGGSPGSREPESKETGDIDEPDSESETEDRREEESSCAIWHEGNGPRLVYSRGGRRCGARGQLSGLDLSNLMSAKGTVLYSYELLRSANNSPRRDRPAGDGLLFDSRFESGNLLYAVRSGLDQYLLVLQNDTNSQSNTLCMMPALLNPVG